MGNTPGAVVDFTSWYAALANAIPWLFADPNGYAEGASLGAFADAQRLYLKQGIQQRFPDFCAPDALPYLGGDRKLVRGPSETKPNFIIRLKDPWSDWARAGTWLELLVQLYWGGFTGAVIVQQNGLAYNLSGTPTAGVDPTALLTITTLNATTTTLTSSVTPSRSIPAGTPWFWFDGDTDHCSRFAVLFPGTLPSLFRTLVTATFTASDSADITWPSAFVDTTYVILPGVPTISSGGPVSVVADSTTKTPTGVTIRATAPFTGTVDVWAYQLGANPLADLHPADVARLRQLILTWRPNALCMGVYALTAGEMWDYPPGLTWDGDSNTWDQPNAASVQVLGVF